MNKDFEWTKPDWSKLEASFPQRGDFYVGERDIEKFVADACIEAEFETGMSIDEFVEANRDFYEAKEELFSSYYCLDKENHRLLAVEQLLMVPKLC